ncbi:putative RNA helicase [Helianthus annuus]|uniref:ATP-dependent RNA helicase n=1 Tax=Helianthus annuus TaxID=4232 RepID=A0A251SFT2_HELAN|nr:DEAD-box ATP-dependent RNA helicase 13 [Helianthus annuus]KAF5768186.1 putative RNA helicase [Helianthus annuus]KAJ0484980.1 putative RNA helicase [Helianthus annuus]KAJ0655531.1 putative RNA helicase [Helianthus annuus]KAJ0659216.1 putative RNA helicase [Helianthus annuus]KAJ0839487.1 putative RNA helicase [Helianthus annuus]
MTTLPPKKKQRNRKPAKSDAAGQRARLDSLRWTSSLPDDGDDPFSAFAGLNDFEGGVLSLDEIDASEYGLELLEGISKGGKKQKKETKRKRKESNGDEVMEPEDADGETVKEVKKSKKKKKKKTKKAKKPEESNDNEEEPVNVANTNDKTDVEIAEEDEVDDSEYHAWYELRLHPLLMKSICRLKFKEPTPIQKACIPAGAHQGKDVIGAAETGSGKTLAFGIPILQRLLEEREKFERQAAERGQADEKIVSKGFLRALIITPTRELALQVTDHMKQVAIGTDVKVVPIVGGMSTEKQERLLKGRPEIVVGTPGRLWELMSGGEIHLVELHSLSFFVLDEADRMIDNGHFQELQSIIDMLPMVREGHAEDTENCVTASGFQRKKRQTFVFSATIALSSDFRKKLKRGSGKTKQDGELNSIEALSERAGMRSNAAVIDLTNASIMANNLEESFIECKEEDKDAYLYYILSVHGQGRTIVFCTSIAALRHLSSLMKILNVNVWTLHAQMQQRARLKAIDRFRGSEHGILIATDVAARGLDIPGVRTVVHYQLPHSAEVYVHRSGRTARASADGCSIALISPKETSKFASLCRSFSKESFKQFPIEASYMPEVLKRLSLARQIDRVLRKESQDKADKSWFQRNAESIELIVDENDSDDETANKIRKKKASSAQLKKLQQELSSLLSRPLQPKTFSSRYLAGAGISPLLQQQFEELAKQKLSDFGNAGDTNKKRKMVVIGQDCVEPLQALRSSGQEISMDTKGAAEKRRNLDNLRRKRKEDKKRLHDQKRKERKRLKAGGD